MKRGGWLPDVIVAVVDYLAEEFLVFLISYSMRGKKWQGLLPGNGAGDIHLILSE